MGSTKTNLSSSRESKGSSNIPKMESIGRTKRPGKTFACAANETKHSGISKVPFFFFGVCVLLCVLSMLEGQCVLVLTCKFIFLSRCDQFLISKNKKIECKPIG